MIIKHYKSANSQFYFTLCGRTAQVVLTSETYTSRSDRNRASVKLNKKFIAPAKVVDMENTTTEKHASKHASKYPATKK